MYQLFYQLSGIMALLVFLSRIWGTSSIEDAFLAATMTGMGIYFVLAISFIALQQVLSAAPKEEREDPEAEHADAEDISIEAEPQAA